jgi:DNA-binding NarL/FixJ family response regulator
VLGLIAEGCSNQGVAHRIFITQRSVEKHVTAIMSKLDLPPEPEAHRRVMAVLAYLEDAGAGAARAGA